MNKMYFYSGGNSFGVNTGASYSPTNEIRGVLVKYFPHATNNREWLVAQVSENEDDLAKVYIDPSQVSFEFSMMLDRLMRTQVRLYASGNQLHIEGLSSPVDADNINEKALRKVLVEGAAMGNINTEDIPALIELYMNGSFESFTKWLTFKRQLEGQELGTVKDGIESQIDELQKAITLKESMRDEYRILNDDVDREVKAFDAAIRAGISILNGNNLLTKVSDIEDKHISELPEGYKSLSEFLREYKKREIFVLLENRLYRIRHMYTDDKGAPILLGDSAEIRRKPTEECVELDQRLFGLIEKYAAIDNELVEDDILADYSLGDFCENNPEF